MVGAAMITPWFFKKTMSALPMTLAIRAPRPWRIASGSHSLTGIQAAAVCGLGVSVLPVSAVLPEHSVCTDLPDLSPTELA